VDGKLVAANDTWHTPVTAVTMLVLWAAGIVHSVLVYREWQQWVAAQPRVTYVPMPMRPLVPPPVASGRGLLPAPGARVLREPWAGFVRNAEACRDRFRVAVAQVSSGPLNSTLYSLVARVEGSVGQCRQIAWHGDAIVAARASSDVDGIVIDMEALRLALEAVDAAEISGS
jgi:hypothetical protein